MKNLKSEKSTLELNSFEVKQISNPQGIYGGTGGASNYHDHSDGASYEDWSYDTASGSYTHCETHVDDDGKRFLSY